ncbi:MAG: Hsp20/alpha crystallin family protein [Ilumatobacteraceae bacterium]
MKHATIARPEPAMRLPDLFDMRRWFDTVPSWFAPYEAIRVEEELRDDAYVVRAEVPGIDPDEDAEIWIADGMLHIEVERECETRSTDGDFRSEFRYGSFERAIALPEGVTADDVKATYADGVLEVRLPKRAVESHRSTVPITKG